MTLITLLLSPVENCVHYFGFNTFFTTIQGIFLYIIYTVSFQSTLVCSPLFRSPFLLRTFLFPLVFVLPAFPYSFCLIPLLRPPLFPPAFLLLLFLISCVFFLIPPSFPQVRQRWCAATPDVRQGNITSTHSLLHLTHSYLYEYLIHHRATCCCYNNLPRLTVYPRRFSIPLTHPPRLCVKERPPGDL